MAEDNEINQKLIEFLLLSKASGSVTIANNLRQKAVKHLQQNKVYDLIIMDHKCLKWTAKATTYYIRHQLRLTTPIIAMTATAMKDEQWQCLHAGMNEYMTKPFEFALNETNVLCSWMIEIVNPLSTQIITQIAFYYIALFELYK